MEFKALRMYFKAAVIVPFYTICFLLLASLFTGYQPLTEDYLKVTFYSGITGLLATTIFLNRFRKIAFHVTYSVLSFFLLPCLFIIYVLFTEVDWQLIKISKGNVAFTTLLFIIFFMHVIGLIISFVDFRKSIVKTQEEERNELRTIYENELPQMNNE